MGTFSSLFGGNKRLKNVSREYWQEIITCLSNETKDIRELFFQDCIYIIKDSEYSNYIINSKFEGKAEIITKAYQLFYMINLLPRYIQPSDGKDFSTMLFNQICDNQFDIIYEFTQIFSKLGG